MSRCRKALRVSSEDANAGHENAEGMASRGIQVDRLVRQVAGVSIENAAEILVSFHNSHICFYSGSWQATASLLPSGSRKYAP